MSFLYYQAFYFYIFLFLMRIYSKTYTTCPGTFVLINENVTYNHEMIRVEGTNCAYNYRNPIYTTKEYNTFDTVTCVTSTIGSISILLLVAIWIKSKQRFRKFLIISFACVSAIPSIIISISSFIPPEKRLSKSLIEPLDYSNGITFCAVQSFILTYGTLAAANCWLVVAMSLFAKIVLNKKIHQMRYMIISNIIIIFYIPLIPTIYMFSQHQYGYGGNMPWCFVRRSAGRFYDLDIFYLPIFFTLVFGLLLTIPVIYTIINTQLKTQASNSNPASANNSYRRRSTNTTNRKSKSNDVGLNNLITSITSHRRITPTSSEDNINQVASTRKVRLSVIVSPKLRSSSVETPSNIILSCDSSSVPSTPANKSNTVIPFSTHIETPVDSSKASNSSRRVSLKLANFNRSTNIPHNANTIIKIKEIFKTLKTSLSFLLFYLLLWIPIYTYRYYIYKDYNDILVSLHSWTDCVFTNYDMINDSSYIDVCGMHPKYRFSIGYNIFCLILLSGQSIFVVLTFVSLSTVIHYINNTYDNLMIYITNLLYTYESENYEEKKSQSLNLSNNNTKNFALSNDSLDASKTKHSNAIDELSREYGYDDVEGQQNNENNNNQIHEINLPGTNNVMYVPHKALTRFHSDKSIQKIVNQQSKLIIKEEDDDNNDDGLDIFTNANNNPSPITKQKSIVKIPHQTSRKNINKINEDKRRKNNKFSSIVRKVIDIKHSKSSSQSLDSNDGHITDHDNIKNSIDINHDTIINQLDPDNHDNHDDSNNKLSYFTYNDESNNELNHYDSHNNLESLGLVQKLMRRTSDFLLLKRSGSISSQASQSHLQFPSGKYSRKGNLYAHTSEQDDNDISNTDAIEQINIDTIV